MSFINAILKNEINPINKLAYVIRISKLIKCLIKGQKHFARRRNPKFHVKEQTITKQKQLNIKKV